MALTTRGRGELDWPEWFTSRFGIDWPEWPELFTGDTIRVEEFRDDGELVVRAELPDIDPENDVEITLVDHALRISAERRQSEEHRDKRGYRSEFRYGSFSRTVRLPAGATEKDVKATYKDGILEVRVPLDQSSAESRKIPIERG